MLFACEHVLLNCSHERLVLTHLLQRLPDVLQLEQAWVLSIELEELSKVRMLLILLSYSLLLEHSEEVFCLQECHREVLRLSLDILLKNDVLEELLRRNVLLKQVHHEHYHDLHRLLVKLREVKRLIFLFLLRYRLLFFSFLLGFLFTVIHFLLLLIQIVFIIFVILVVFVTHHVSLAEAFLIFVVVVKAQILHDLQEFRHNDVAVKLWLSEHSQERLLLFVIEVINAKTLDPLQQADRGK